MSLLNPIEDFRRLYKYAKEKLTPLGFLNALIIGMVFVVASLQPIWNIVSEIFEYIVKITTLLLGKTAPNVVPLNPGGIDQYLWGLIGGGLLCTVIVGFFEKDAVWPEQKKRK